MREIKFRAWDNSQKKMFYPEETLIASMNEGYAHIEQSFIIEEMPYNSDFWNSNKKVELMQFTGLKDKNGKEIYEGDIIKYVDDFWSEEDIENGEKNSIVIKEISFRNGRYCLKDSVIDTIEKAIDLGAEVIGNIYENPELLEERK